MNNKDLLDISKITNSPSISGGGYVISAEQLNPDIEGSLRSDINKKLDISRPFYSSQVASRGLKDGEMVEVTLELPISGIFLVETDMGLCNASASTKDCPFVRFWMTLNDTRLWLGIRQTISIPVAKIWDDCITNTFLLSINAGTIVARFHSYLGCQLSTDYDSHFKVVFIPI